MSVVTFTRLWLNDAADSTDGRGFRLASFEPSDDLRTSVVALAGERFRAVTRKGRAKKLTAVLRSPDADDRAWLDDHADALLTVRDPDGGKWAGVLADWTRPRAPRPGGKDQTLVFSMVSHSEKV
jgi:hypothetical protein